MGTSQPLLLAFLTLPLVPLLLSLVLQRRRTARPRKLPPVKERILVLGGSTGIGKSLVERYVSRQSRVCIVGRSASVQELAQTLRDAEDHDADEVIGVQADFTVPEDMIRVRDLIMKEWGGLDTLVVCAGVSALQPLLDITGLDFKDKSIQPDAASVRKVSDISLKAIHGNYTGPLVAAVTFIPLLEATSTAPAVLLISSLASVIPAPTRTLYGSTKSASLLLYQSLSIEHPKVQFTLALPSTVEGNFRASAVDEGPVREKDPNKAGNALRKTAVARRCIQAVDAQEATVFMPSYMRYGHLLYWLWPAFVERQARKKYNF